jgi:predicted nucleic acid-binding protein
MIVVDCTAIADFYIGETSCQKSAQALLEMDPDWISPVLWRYEFGNVLRSQVRGGRISPDLMYRYLREAEGIVMESVMTLDAVAVGEMANTHDLSFYDASYVWLGQVRGLPFYSRDGKLRRKCPDLVLPMPLVD